MVDDGRFDREPELLEGAGDQSWPVGSRAPRRTLALVIVLVAGGLGGYAIGARQHPHAGPGRSPQATQPAARGGATAVGGPPMVQTGATCSVQHGHRLQLGIQINNQSPQAFDVIGVRTRQPLHGLRLIRTASGPCDQRTLPFEPFSNARAPAGASIWLTATERVLVRCPGPDPVLFTVHYVQNGQAFTELLPAFVDLAHVPYSGCTHHP